MESSSLDEGLPLGRGEERGVGEERDEEEAELFLLAQRHLLHDAPDHREQLRERERAAGREEGGADGLLQTAELLQVEQLRVAATHCPHLIDALQHVDDAEVVVTGLAEGQRVLQVPTLRCRKDCSADYHRDGPQRRLPPVADLQRLLVAPQEGLQRLVGAYASRKQGGRTLQPQVTDGLP